jgi:cell wall-associated NlpC family hydrolase
MPLTADIPLFHRRRPSLRVFAISAAVSLLTLILFTIQASTAGAKSDKDAKMSESGGAGFLATPATTPGMRAKIAADGRTALAPEGAPDAVKEAIAAANQIIRKPYIYGGGHATFKKLARGYDCSGTVSWALGNAGLLKGGPLDSTSFMRWGKSGKGNWITVYTNPGHAYVYIAGLRFDTSGPGERGPRWRKAKRSDRGFRARHIVGL